MVEYIKRKDALHILDLVLEDDTITHKYKAIRKRLKGLPETDVIEKSEFERLKEVKEQLENDVINANMNSEHLLAELENLKAEIDQPFLMINADYELTTEIREAIKMQKAVIVPDNEEIAIHIDIASIKAEAVKEFAERLKDYYIKNKRYDRPYAHTMICLLFALIDDIKEEMVGEG